MPRGVLFVEGQNVRPPTLEEGEEKEKMSEKGVTQKLNWWFYQLGCKQGLAPVYRVAKLVWGAGRII
jgi:hypothetical protein